MNLHYKKAALLAALNARMAWAVKKDKRDAAAHKKAEAKHLADFRAACRKALAMDYKAAKRANFQLGDGFGRWGKSAPSCPVSVVEQLRAAIDQVTRDGRERYAINDNGRMAHVHWLLTHDDRVKPNVCE